MTDGSPSGSPASPKSSLTRRIAQALDLLQKLGFLYPLLKRRRLHELPPGHPPGAIDVLVDRYVLVSTALAAVVYAVSFIALPIPYTANFVLATLVILVSFWRIIETSSFHLNMLISRVGRPGGVPTVASYERSFVLMLLNYIEVTFWFATWYSISVRQGVLTGPTPLPLSIFRESLAMMLVNTSGLFMPSPSRLLWTAMCFQSVVGLFLTIVVVTRTLAMLPAPEEDRPPNSFQPTSGTT
jgi:hypothetical protein